MILKIKLKEILKISSVTANKVKQSFKTTANVEIASTEKVSQRRLLVFFGCPLMATILLLCCSLVSIAQKDSSVFVPIPRVATIRSAIVPGLGQIYNKKWWKVPIIYGAIGGLVYSSYIANSNYQELREAYVLRSNGKEVTTGKYQNPAYSQAVLLNDMDFYRYNRDFSYILLGLTYILNIVDANVDAHLYNFNVSEDLSFQIHPAIENGFNGPNSGLRIAMIFK